MAHEGATVRIGISSCLLGREVRWDGGHKRDERLAGTLGAEVELVPVCPEVEVGMGVPREAVELVGEPAAPRLLGVDSRTDWTDRMRAFAERRAEELARLDLDGYVLKARSPSCGLRGVPVHDEAGEARAEGPGRFAEALTRRLSRLPVEEEGPLAEPEARDHFLERVAAHHRLRTFLAGEPRPGELVAFHTRSKFQLMAHDVEGYRELGRLVGEAGERPDPAELLEAYARRYMEVLAEPTTRGKHTSVLSHLVSYLKRALDRASKHELLGVIEAYRVGEAALSEPLALLRAHFRDHPVRWVAEQTYLYPPPWEARLRSRASQPSTQSK